MATERGIGAGNEGQWVTPLPAFRVVMVVEGWAVLVSAGEQPTISHRGLDLMAWRL